MARMSLILAVNRNMYFSYLTDDGGFIIEMCLQPSLVFQMSYNDYDSEDGDSNLEFSDDEYNSEDDEFLAFHDADIEAQVDRLEILSSY